MEKLFNILAVGDVVGRAGRSVLATRLRGLIDLHRIDFVIVNGENSAGGRSITPEIYREFLDLDVDVVTTGNHVWDNNDVLKRIDQEDRLLRPPNFPPGVRGKGICTVNRKGRRVTVINLMGRSMMEPIDCPFRAFDSLYESCREESDMVIVDFHAETTSEKRAFGWYVDGRATAIFGTHTHVQTADEEIFPGGTGYITDAGMTGPFDSVIGMDKEGAIHRFLYQTRVRVETASGNPRINGVIFGVDGSGRTSSIQRINQQ
jgi:metallophosphoesterase (TIGR00282 family)